MTNTKLQCIWRGGCNQPDACQAAECCQGLRSNREKAEQVPSKEKVADRILSEAIDCCRSWEPEVRLIGNVRAIDLRDLLLELWKHRNVPSSANEPAAEPAGYRVDYTAGKVEAFFLTSPGCLQDDLQSLKEDGRTNIRATPLYRAAPPPPAESSDIDYLMQSLVDQENALNACETLLKESLAEDGVNVDFDARLERYWAQSKALGDWRSRNLRLSQPPGALRPGLERAEEIISAIETPADQYEPYKNRLLDALRDAIYSSETKGSDA